MSVLGEVESLGVRQRGDGCGRGRGSGRPGRAMRRGLLLRQTVAE